MKLIEIKDENKQEENSPSAKTLKDVFAENEQNIKPIKWIESFYAKEIEKTTAVISRGKKTLIKPGNYLLRSAINPKAFKTINKKEFDEQFSKIRQTDKPDAEGFILVKQNDNIEGFQYNESDNIVMNNKNEHLTLKKSMWVLRYIDDPDTGWLLSDSEFNKSFKI